MPLPLGTTGAGGATLSTRALETTLALPLCLVKLCIVQDSSGKSHLGGLCLACAAPMAWGCGFRDRSAENPAGDCMLGAAGCLMSGGLESIMEIPA